MTRKLIAVEKFDCPTCKAPPRCPCLDQARKYTDRRTNVWPHKERVDEARKAGY